MAPALIQPLLVDIKFEDSCKFFDLKWADIYYQTLQQVNNRCARSLVRFSDLPLSRPSFLATTPNCDVPLMRNSAAGLPSGGRRNLFHDFSLSYKQMTTPLHSICLL